MHSAVFALNPRSAGEIAVRFGAQDAGSLRPAKVMDVDEALLREGAVSARLYGYLRVPAERRLLQGAKARSLAGEEAKQAEIAHHLVDRVMARPPGSSVRGRRRKPCSTSSVSKRPSSAWIRVVRGGCSWQMPTSEPFSRSPRRGRPSIVVTPVGGQGFVSAAGTSSSRRRCSGGRRRTQLVIATEAKLAALAGGRCRRHRRPGARRRARRLPARRHRLRRESVYPVTADAVRAKPGTGSREPHARILTFRTPRRASSGRCWRPSASRTSTSSTRRSRSACALRGCSTRAGRRSEVGAAPPGSRECSRGTRARATAVSFLGGGCWQHYVPAVVDEIVEPRRVRDRVLRRDVLRPRQAAGALRVREPGRRPGGVRRRLAADLRLGVGRGERDPDGRSADRPDASARAALASGPSGCSIVEGNCGARMTVEDVPFDAATGLSTSLRCEARSRRRGRLRLLREPGLPRQLEPESAAIARARARHGALAVVGRRRDLARRARGAAALRRRPRLRRAAGARHPHALRRRHGRLHRQRRRGAVRGRVPDVPDRRRPHGVDGEWGFGEVRWERMSYVQRGEREGLHRHDAEPVGDRRSPSTSRCSGRTGCASSARRSCSGASYAAQRLGEIPGVRAPALSAPFFKEFVVDFDDTGRTVADVNRRSPRAGIFGAARPLRALPGRSASRALFCVTEVHTQADIDRLVDALAAAIA